MDTYSYNDNVSNCYRSAVLAAATSTKRSQRSQLDNKIHKLKKVSITGKPFLFFLQPDVLELVPNAACLFFVQMLKPIMKFVRNRFAEKSYYHKEADPVPCCWSDPCEDNAANEALEARLRGDLECSAGVKGDAIQVWVGGQVVTIPVVPGQPQIIPVHFVIGGDCSDGFSWVPYEADSDICCENAACYQTEYQVAEVQTPCAY